MPDNQSAGLCRQTTLLAEDFTWTKPKSVPGQPAPIPPRNEPHIYFHRTADNFCKDSHLESGMNAF
jgi:hypothetical protein